MAKKKGAGGGGMKNGHAGGGIPGRKRDRRPSWERNGYLKDPIAPLQRVMDLLGFSQTLLAEKIHQAVQQTRISKWLRLEGTPDIAQYEAMCRAMGVGVDMMFELRPEQITRDEIAVRRSVRNLINLIGYAEAERRLAGLPMAPAVASAVHEGKLLGDTRVHRLGDPGPSDAGRAGRTDKAKAGRR